MGHIEGTVSQFSQATVGITNNGTCLLLIVFSIYSCFENKLLQEVQLLLIHARTRMPLHNCEHASYMHVC